jgi:FtsH-binding integral membrane protein
LEQNAGKWILILIGLGFFSTLIAGARVVYDVDGHSYNYAFFTAVAIFFLASLIGYLMVRRNFRSVKYMGLFLCFLGEILVWGSDYFYSPNHEELQAYYDIARSAFW